MLIQLVMSVVAASLIAPVHKNDALPVVRQAEGKRFLDARNLCRETNSYAFSIKFKAGMTTTFVLVGPTLSEDDEEAARLTEAFGTKAFLTVMMGANTLLVTSSQAPMKSVGEFKREADRFCSVERSSTYKVSQVSFTTAEERTRIELERLRDAAKRRLNQNRWSRQQLKTLPDQLELSTFLRENWEKVGYLWGQSDTNFIRLRDNECRRRGRNFRCKMGVLVSSKFGPDYAQSNVTFVRQQTEKGFPLQLIEPEIIVVT